MGRDKYFRGFTLIELSIVLVVIGLIIGGVLVGRSLIEAASVRSLATDKERLQTAIRTFQGKYNSLPGDYPNASITLGTGGMEAAANGNGNGTIDDFNSVGNQYPWYLEQYFFWRHLAAANMLGWTLPGYAGSFSGIVQDAQIPSLRYANNLLIGSVSGFGASAYENGYTYGQNWGAYAAAFRIGGAETSTLNLLPLLTPQAVQALDRKISDGLPSTGTVRVLGNASTWWGDTYQVCDDERLHRYLYPQYQYTHLSDVLDEYVLRTAARASHTSRGLIRSSVRIS